METQRRLEGGREGGKGDVFLALISSGVWGMETQRRLEGGREG